MLLLCKYPEVAAVVDWNKLGEWNWVALLENFRNLQTDVTGIN